MIKSTIPDGGNRIRNVNGSQPYTMIKSPIPNGGNRVRNADGVQAYAMIKSPIADGLNSIGDDGVLTSHNQFIGF